MANLDAGTAQVTVKLGVVTLVRNTYTLADLLTEWGQPCRPATGCLAGR